MEIKTCEEYVLSRLDVAEKTNELLQETIDNLNKTISEYEGIITTYDELFREHGSKDVFDCNAHVNVDVSEAYKGEKEYYEFLMNRNGQFLKVNDYRKKTDENSQEDEE